MSYNPYSVNMFGAKIDSYDIREELGEEYFGDISYTRGNVLLSLQNGGTVEGFPEDANDVEIISGYGCTWFIGYSAQMPYKKPLGTKKELTEKIRKVLVFLVGEKTAKKIKIEPFYEVWIE